MARTLIPRFIAALEISRLGDDEAHQVVANIQQSAQTSAVVQANPALAATVAALVAKDAALGKANATVESDKQALKLDIAAEGVARADLRAELRAYTTLLTNLAQSPADIQGGGLSPRGPLATKNTPPTVPEGIDVRYPRRGRGTATVSVHETGTSRHQFTAQQSVDGGVTWTALGVGRGKSRAVIGASGAQIWVRFAMVRGGRQSDWCTPVLVTIP